MPSDAGEETAAIQAVEPLATAPFREQLYGKPRMRRYNLTPRPLQFPSLAHFDERFAELLRTGTTIEALSPKTLAWMRNAYASWRRFLRTTPDHEMRFLSGDALQQQKLAGEWIAWLRETGVSRTTVATYWHGLNTTFRRLEVQDGSFNPLAYLPRPKAAPPLPRCLTRSVAEALLVRVRNYPWESTFAMHRNLAIVSLMLMAGLRRGEVIRLGYGDVDLSSGTIRIVRGKGRHGGKDRTAYATPQLVAILSAYTHERRKIGRTHPTFITSVRGNRGIGEVTVRRLFAIMSRELQLRISPHVLRHTYATMLRQSGVPDRIAQELLGHASLTMLYRYSHVFEGECVSEAARLHFAA